MTAFWVVLTGLLRWGGALFPGLKPGAMMWTVPLWDF